MYEKCSPSGNTVQVVVVGMLLLLSSKARQETEVSPVVASVLFLFAFIVCR